MPTATNCLEINWLVKADMPAVLRIENATSPLPWDVKTFSTTLRSRNAWGLKAKYHDVIVGFLVLELYPKSMGLLNFAVDPDFTRLGFGSAMMDKLKTKLAIQRRKAIEYVVRESCLDGLLFLRSQGFKAEHLIREHFGDEDAVLMRYGVEAPVENRLENYFQGGK